MSTKIANPAGAYGQTAVGPQIVDQFVASGAIAANDWVSRTGPYTVEKMDVSDGDVAGLLCAGVALDTAASGALVRVAVSGEAVANIGTTTIAAIGDIAVPHASTDGASGTIAASAIGESTQDVQIGVYLSTEIGTSNTATVQVTPPSRTGGVEAGAIGTASIADDAVTNDKLANITRGSVKVGGAANAPTDLVALTSGRILVGDGTDVLSVAVSGDATLSAAGAVTIANGAVTNAKLAVPKVSSLSQTVAFGDFTDGGGTSGYVDLTTQLEAAAIPLGWKAVVATGFTGDTTAVIQLGVSGDVDRFSADTAQSVLTAATVGSNCLAADASDGMNAAQSVRVTVTGAADFTSITAGSMTVTLYYIETV